jgi:hypothetical protein
MIKDPEFVRMGKLQFSEDFRPIHGELQQEFVQKTAYPSKEITAFMDDMKIRNGLPAEALSDEELAAMAKAKGLDKTDTPPLQAKLTAVGAGGRDIEFMVDGASKKLDVSSSRTRVSIAGQKAARDQLKAGMDCSIQVMGESKDADGITCN